MSKNQIRIIAAQPHHRPDIIGFQLLMAMETESLQLDRNILEKGVQAVFEDASKGQYFVAVADETVVGSFLITYEWSDWRNGNVWWLQSVYVKREFRKLGIFNTMYQRLKDIVANQPEVMGIRLYVDKTNTKAQKVYQKKGLSHHHYDMYEWMK
ncbi:MAG TPA: GNAT family N-acetyltransferase [Cytophagales bacterium]|jgi:GNAT superfamily N-acetyltransferase|nr:GNAT family N-acetyltransferase [Cytophagales bacterium]